ncbi:MAG TPA: Hpt domain-containing protein, partial [Pyrinomonadaceae bacterium]|nr:Hpt domain-containing protein [Pyrinomonadaceae bacterium]
MDQSGPDFQSEIAELLERFFQDLEKLREEFADVSARRNLIGSIFRRVHSLKGCANTAALEETGTIAHHLEDLLADIRDHKVELTESLLDLIEDAGNLITATLGPAPPAGTSIEGFLSYLQAVERTRLPAHVSACPPTLPSDIWQSLNETQQRHLVRALDDGLELYIITTSFDIADFDQQFYRLKETLDDLGEVISTYPSVGFAQTHGINFRILFV